jgi:SAM-dependent methyltransferase
MTTAFKARLSAKITREQLRTFLLRHASDTLALEVGAKDKPYRDLFPKTISGDIVRYPSLDAQFDAHRLPFADCSFGLIVCTEVLEHCVEPHRVLNEFHRVLRPGGKLILTTRFIFPIHDAPYDYFRFTRYGLQYLCREFAEIQIVEEAATVATMAVLMQRLAYQGAWKLPGMRGLLHLMSRVILRMTGLLKAEYGDIRRQSREHAILASGYYVVATKSRGESA